MKARGLILIDFDLPGGFKDAAIEQEKMERMMNELVRGNPRVVYSQCEIKERRGDSHPDLTKLKIRTS